MHILVTGANGFLGKHTCAWLQSMGDHTVHPIDIQSTEEELAQACKQAEFVFHLAGVNRPKEESEFTTGNVDFTAHVMALLSQGKKPPVVITSSIQAAQDNAYGKSKALAEETVRAYGEANQTTAYVYRLVNAFGKWSRPCYNSAVATFCHHIARGLPVEIHNSEAPLQLCYVDDILTSFEQALTGTAEVVDGFCYVTPIHQTTVGKVHEAICQFAKDRETLTVPDQTDPLIRKLYATYISFLPPEDFAKPVVVHSDARGSFAELLHMAGHGQVSINIQKPHIGKGEHWHHTKHEKFIVVSGTGVIGFRKPSDTTVIRYKVSGDAPKVVDIPPGYTHNIQNLGDTDMITVMWASECFDPAHPDTFALPVEQGETNQ